MLRRVAISAFAAMLVTSSANVHPITSIARAETPAATGHYTDAAHWLFDLYLNQSIRLTIANAGQAHPKIIEVLTPQMPAMVRVLDRHRSPFVEAMQQPLRGHFNEAEIATLTTRVVRQQLALDDASRTRLIAVDQEFRRESQKVIRGITHDLGLLVSEALAAAPPIKQN